MIQSIVPIYDSSENWDGFIATVTLEEVKIIGQSQDLDTDVLDSYGQQSYGGF